MQAREDGSRRRVHLARRSRLPSASDAQRSAIKSAMTSRIAVLASGGGLNLQAIVEHFERPPGAVASRPRGSEPGEIAALDRAATASIEWRSTRPTQVRALGLLQKFRVDLIVLAAT